MKYAFIIGSNAFIVPHGVISYGDHGNLKEILRVRYIYHDNQRESFLSVDLDIKDNDGHDIKLNANKAVNSGTFTINTEQNSVKVLKHDGSLIIHVHQMDDKSAMRLQLNITAELEVNAPVVAIRINGEFMAENLNIIGENEKLYINDNAYATSALAGTNTLQFTADGVVL
jgi:hypothetical protein